MLPQRYDATNPAGLPYGFTWEGAGHGSQFNISGFGKYRVNLTEGEHTFQLKAITKYPKIKVLRIQIYHVLGVSSFAS